MPDHSCDKEVNAVFEMPVNFQGRSGNLVYHLPSISANGNKLEYGSLSLFYGVKQLYFFFQQRTAFRGVLIYQILVASLLLLYKHSNIPTSMTYFSCAVGRLMAKAVHLVGV